MKPHHEWCTPAHTIWKAAYCSAWNKEAAFRLFSWVLINITWPLELSCINLECQELNKKEHVKGQTHKKENSSKTRLLRKQCKELSLGEYPPPWLHQVRTIYTSQGSVYHQRGSYTKNMLQKKEWLNKWPGATSMHCWQSLLQLERIVSYRELGTTGMKENYRRRQEKIPEQNPCMQIFYNFHFLLNNASYLWGVKQSIIFKGYLYVPLSLCHH